MARKSKTPTREDVFLPEPPSAALFDASYASLAREIAQDIRLPADILPNYGFTGPDDPAWIALQKSHDFVHLLIQAAREWNAADSTAKRIRYKALASLELVIAEMHVIAITHTSAERRIEAAKFIKDLAGFGGNGGIGGTGALEGSGGVSITINIGEKVVRAQLSQPKTIDSQAEEVQ
jgi:hypothetical protein